MITIGDTSWLRPLDPPEGPTDTAWLRPLEQAPGAPIGAGPVAYAPSRIVAGPARSSSVSLLSNLQSLRSAMGTGVAIARPVSSGMPGTVPSVPAGPPTLDRAGGGYDREPTYNLDLGGAPYLAIGAAGVVVAGLAYFLLRRKK